MDEDKVQSVASTLLQICVTILPIGAGASSYIAQQDRSIPIIVALGFVWAGLVSVSISAFLSLSVLQFSKGNPLQIAANQVKFRRAIGAFIVGVVFLVLSPGGFSYHYLNTSQNVSIVISNNKVRLSLPNTETSDTVIVTSLQNVNSIQSMQINTEISDGTCLTVTKINEQTPKYQGDYWLISWKISVVPTCTTGDYLVLFKVLKNNSLVGINQLTISVVP